LLVHAVRNAQPGLVYNLFAPGAFVTQQEFAEKLAALTGVPIRQYRLEEVRRKFGQAAAEAFTFSNLSATRHPEFLKGYRFKFPTVEAMLRNNLEPAWGA
jgi:nucleoside-diphosphate-sugar epimerase